MATLNIQNFITTVENQVAAIQTQCSQLFNFATGAILRAVANSNAAVAMWLQGGILEVLSISRFITSFGADADSFGQQFGYSRAPAAYAIGPETFSRYSTTQATAVPIGATVMTQDKTQSFAVIADASNPAYNATSNNYPVAAGVASVTATVQSLNAALAANVIPGSVTVMTTGISGIDYCTNPLSFTGGLGAQSDPSYKAGFPGFLIALARGTPAAIQAAVEAMQTGTQCTILENTLYGGATQNGYCTVVVDDGTGAPSQAFVNAAAAIVNAYRAGSIRYGVFGATTIPVNVSFTLMTAGLTSTAHAAAVATAQLAVTAFIDSLPDGAPLAFTELYQVIWDSGAGIITDVTNLLVNGSTNDITPAWVYDVIKVGTVVGT